MEKNISKNEYLEMLTSRTGKKSVSHLRKEFGREKAEDIKILDVLLRNAFDHIDDLDAKLNNITDKHEIEVIKNKIINTKRYINKYVAILDQVMQTY